MEIAGSRGRKTRQFSVGEGGAAQCLSLSPAHPPQGYVYHKRSPFSNVGAVLRRIKGATEATSVKTREEPFPPPAPTELTVLYLLKSLKS